MTALASSARSLLLLLAASAVWAQTPNPAQPYILSVSYGGTGCPQGSVGSSFTNDRTAFTLVLDSFIASSGPNIPITEKTKSCTLNVNLHLPPGHSIWAQTSTAKGYAQMPAGQDASITSRAVLSTPPGERKDDEQDADDNGVSERVNLTKFKGPVAKDYTVVDGHQYAVETDCAATSYVRTITLQYALAVSGPDTSQLTLDSLDGKINVVKTKACKKD
mgnify:CR=1 FL=1